MKRKLLALCLAAAAFSLAGCEEKAANEAVDPPAEPVLTLAAPVDGTLLPPGAVVVSGSAFAEAAPAALTLAIDGGAPSPVEIAEGGAFSVEIAPGEGAHTLRLVLVDALARRAERAISFTVEGEARPAAPVITLHAPAAGAELAFGPIDVSGTVAAEAGIGSLVLRLDGGNAEPITVDADGRFSVSIEAAEGSHTLRLELVDALDRQATADVAFTVLPPPDQTAPTLSVDPVPSVTTVRQVELRGVATDDRELAEVRLIVPEGEQALPIAEDGSFEITIVPRNGANEFALVAVDASGNESAQTISFFYGSIASAGAAHTGVIRDGGVWAWGRHNKGQVGVGGEASDANAQLVPQPVAGLPRVHWLSFGQNSSVAVGEDGSVWTWGSNDDGQLGLGLPPNGELPAVPDTLPRSTPQRVPGLDDAVAAATGYNHVLVLRADGTVVAFGRNAKGQLGDGTTTGRSWPMQVQGIDRIVKVIAGSEHSAALRDDGTVFLFGRNTYGNLAQGGIDAEAHPVAMPALGLEPAVDLATGRDHVVALHPDGTASAWGLNASGQLGDNTEINRGTPAPVLELEGAVAVSANGNYTLARKGDGSIWGWGQGGNAQFGTGTTGNVATPTAPAHGLADVVAAAAGATHVVAVRADGTVFTWGWNIYGSLGNPLLPHNWSVPTPTALELP